MPFDGLVPVRTKVRLEDMPAILRDRSRWPEGFEWDYDRLETCGLGLCQEMGVGSYSDICARLGYRQWNRTFFASKALTPEVVARRLERAMRPSWWRRWLRA